MGVIGVVFSAAVHLREDNVIERDQCLDRAFSKRNERIVGGEHSSEICVCGE